MDSNTYSARRSGRLAALVAVLDDLDSEDLERLTDVAAVEEVLELRPLVERLEGQWLRRLPVVDGRGAAGADQDRRFGSTTGWLRARLRLSTHAAATAVRTARAVFHGPLTGTAQALLRGEVSADHAQVLASSTQQLPAQVAADAEPTLLEAAGPVDPPQLRRAVAHLRYTADPEGADRAAQRRYERRGLWFTATMDGMVAVGGHLEPEAGQIVLTALDALARPADHHDTRSGGQRNADALHELARRQLEAGQLPRVGGVRPQLSVVVDLPSLKGLPGGIGAEAGGVEPLTPQACRRLACDGAVTRVLVSRQPLDPSAYCGGGDPGDGSGRESLLRAVMAKLPPVLGGAPSQPSTWAARPGWSARPSTAPWPSATVAVSSRAVRGRWPGVRPIMCGIGWMVARPTWTT